MKRIVMRRVALAICAVMLLCVIPGKAQALPLDGKQMPQLQQVSVDGGIHFFTDYMELYALASEASGAEQHYVCVYNSNVPLTTVHTLVIPSNMHVELGSDLIVPEGKYLVVQGSLSCVGLDVQGSAVIEAGGSAAFRGDVAVSGAMDVYGGFTVNANAQLAPNIRFLGESFASAYYEFANEAQLREVVEKVGKVQNNWGYFAYPTASQIHFSQPITIPERLELRMNRDGLKLSGERMVVNGALQITGDGTVIDNKLVLKGDTAIGAKGAVFTDYVTILGYMNVYGPVTFQSGVRNLHVIDIWYDQGGRMTVEQGQLYEDVTDDYWGTIFVDSYEPALPQDVVTGLDLNGFDSVGYIGTMGQPFWFLENYVYSVRHVHNLVTVPGTAPTCMTEGVSDGTYCAQCGEDLMLPQWLAPLGHDYGLTTDGDPDFWDTTCDVCGAERLVDIFRPTHSMYRMYNPVTGEHFYTGSMVERQNLETVGWKYEGIGFTFPASTGAPVYRLYEPEDGEHLYTMDPAEVELLVSKGWNNEGVAFNSGYETEVPQYRLYNPNVIVGAYHFTASPMERDHLISQGWEYQGIGFYTCLQ